MKKKRNKEKGITLIALVVTIILLLLLAGVSFLAITGENSIFRRTNKSAKDTERETLKEEIQLGIMGEYDENGFDIKKFQEEIEKEYGIKVKEEDKWEDGFRFEIEGKYGDYTVLVEKDETGKPRVEIEEKLENGELPKPEGLNTSNTKIELEPSGWTNKGVKVTITIDKSVNKGTSVLQYSIDEGVSWDTYRKPFEIVENNTVVIARLYNGVDESSSYATVEIKKIDKLPPKILSIEEVGHTTSTVTVKVAAKEETETATDGESGIDRYYFMVDNSGKWEPKEGSTSEQYTIEKLKQNKEHEIKVKVTDVAKNETIREEGIKVTTGGLGDLGDKTSNTVIDFNPKDWTGEKVQVTITTNAEISGETRLQYSINEGKEWTDYNDTPFDITENNTVVIARLYDGTNESGYATAEVTKIDKIAPYDVQMEVIGGKKTNKIGVRVSAKDSLSGIKRYKFYYSTNGGESYIEAGTKEVEQEKESTTTYEYENLSDETKYKLKVEAYDYVNNKNEGEVTTEGETEAMPNVNSNNLKIDWTPRIWAKEVTVTITPNGLEVGENEIQYMIEGEEWTDYKDTPFKVAKNTAVVARLYDGTNESGHATGTISYIDKVEPSTVSITENSKNTNSITVNVTAADGSETGESGKSGIKRLKYYYSTNNGLTYTDKDEIELETSNTGTYTSTYKYEGLTAGTKYKLKVEAYDEAGNMTSAETEEIQIGTAPVMSDISATRDYSNSKHSITLTVKATDNEGGTITYNVQYGTSTDYGKTETGTGTAGSNTTIKLDNLSQYTRYYYKVTATDSTGITSTNYKEGDYKTYCIGTYCSGGYWSTRSCTNSKCVGGKITTTVVNGKACTAEGCDGGKITKTNEVNCKTCGATGKVTCGETIKATPPGSVTLNESYTCHYCKKQVEYSGTAVTAWNPYYQCTVCLRVLYYNTVMCCSSSCATSWMNGQISIGKKCGNSVECGTCNGKKVVNEITKVDCEICGGDGKVDSVTESNCPTCGGDGIEDYKKNCTHNYSYGHYRCTISGHGGNSAGYLHGET